MQIYAGLVGSIVINIFQRASATLWHIDSTVRSFNTFAIVFALSRSLWLSTLAMIALGAADVISVVIRSSFVQLSTPDQMRGRVSAVNAMFIGTSNQLGEFESGVTAALFGTVPAVILGGAGTILVALLWMRLFPDLRQADTLESVASAALSEPGKPGG